MRAPVLCLALGLAAGCVPRFNTNPETGGIDVDMEPVTQRAQVWTGTLTSVRGSGISGTARAVVSGDETRVNVSVIGSMPNVAHPWHIHQGTCQSGGGVVGSGGAYPPLMIGNTGQGQASATVGVPLNEAQNYHVNVHASANDMGTIIACGDLDD